MVLALWLAGSAVPAAANVGTTGWLNPPGPGGRLDYRVTLRKVPGTQSKVQFWLDLSNPGGQAVTIIACAMVRLDRPSQPMPQHIISKNGNSWECTANGTVNRPPGYHFGCEAVTVPAGGSAQAFDVTADMGTPFTEDELTSIYWDALLGQDGAGNPCTVGNSCKQALNKPNVNVSPRLGDVITNTANIWGGSIVPEDLTPTGKYRRYGRTETGNWWTMTAGGTYAARYVGTLTEAPPGSVFRMTFPASPPYEAVVPASGRLDIDTPMIVPEDPDALFDIELETTEPLADGMVPRLDLDVVADEWNELYEPGQVMHRIGHIFPGDSEDPFIESVAATPMDSTGVVHFDVEATDAITMPAAASVRVSVLGEPYIGTVHALDFGDPAIIEDPLGARTRFTGDAGPFAPGSVVQYTIMVEDELGNRAEFDGIVPISSALKPANKKNESGASPP